MGPDTPFIDDDSDHDVCWICPALRYPGGRFDVYDRPAREAPFDPRTGFRYTAQGVAVCVHPYKVGLPAGRYASADEPLPAPCPPPARPAGPPAPHADPTASVRQAPVRAFPGPAPVAEVPDAVILAGSRPQVPAELLAWMRGLVADAAPDDLAATLELAEQAARLRFPPDSVVEALRRVLGGCR
ncbi:hypothetical protein [Kitasatospora sp. NBC_01302]|uniref:hypothetical protein n=1 Tax=Kitasatospora sp. NBC_01302 TaxID=2903575 RepID=UPI002E0EB2F8|nr:hypothetical protein OG294_04390 [Kitasatospora sp. NBC_01302]